MPIMKHVKKKIQLNFAFIDAIISFWTFNTLIKELYLEKLVQANRFMRDLQSGKQWPCRKLAN